MIIFDITMLITALTILLALYFTNRSGAKPNGNVLLGLTLPREVMTECTVTAILQKYRKANNLAALVFLVLSVLFVLIPYVSISLMYMVVWGICVFVVFGNVLSKHYDELYAVKREKAWWVGDPRIISVDTEVSRLKDTFPVSKTWYILPLIIAATPIIMLAVNENSDTLLWIFAINGLATCVLAFILSRFFAQDRTIVYSENTGVNFALNRVYKREWSKCWLFAAIIGSAITTAMCLIMQSAAVHVMGFVLYSVLLSACVLVLILLAYGKIRTKRNHLLQVVNESVYTDEDLFWHKGSYCNPNDSRWWVEKRIGYGMTINEGKRGAKLFITTALGITVLMFLGIAVYLLPFDFPAIWG